MNGVNLHTIHGKMFSGSSTATIIHLEDNDLTFIPDEAFEGVSVSELYLHNNKLVSLH